MGEVVGAALVAHVPTIMLPEEVRLDIPVSSLAAAPAARNVRLIDREQETSIDPLAAGGGHVLSFGPEHAYRLTLLAGTEEFLSRQTERLLSIPATLNSTTELRTMMFVDWPT